MNKKKKTAYVALSGGVDSAVSAALLKKAGFDVVGVYMKCWTEGAACTTVEDERSARLVASHLNIPFYSWNFVKEYKEKVVEYMLDGYRQGITPNPDMMCNREIKFGLFFKKAMSLGADFVATGHYAKTKRTGQGYMLYKGADEGKDQSYFLSMIHPDVLSKTLFPLGEYTKLQVRAFARKLGLPNAERKDSQGICFVGKVEIGEFLRLHIEPRKGSIVSLAGKVLGEHDGVQYYTIGQRQGLSLSGGPYYVVAKDVAANTLRVSKDEEDSVKDRLTVFSVNWFLPIPEKKFRATAKFRYRQEDVPVSVEVRPDGSLLVIPDVPQRALTPGQFAVFYLGDKLVAGGVISPHMV